MLHRHPAHNTRQIAAILSAAVVLTAFASAEALAAETPRTSLAETAVSEDMAEVVVVASRLDQRATELGSSVNVITREHIEAAGYDFVLDALASAPGVTVNQNGSFGGFGGIRIRGASSEQTLVLIDGIAVNDTTSPGGGFDISRLDTAVIERIEILKGAQSTLWGTDAIGGVVNVITRRGTTEVDTPALRGELFAEYGAFDTRRGGGSVGGSNTRGSFNLSATTLHSDGISKADRRNANPEKDGYESTTLNANGSIILPAEVKLSVSALYTDAETEFDSFVFGAQGNVGDGDDTSKTEELAGHVALDAPLFGGRLKNKLLVGFSKIDRANFAGGAPSFAAKGDRTTYRYQGTLTIDDRNSLAFGAEREKSDNNVDTTNLDGLFALYEYQPLDGMTLTAGLRTDDADDSGSETTARFAMSWRATDQWTVRGSWGQGFKAPTLFQTTFFCCGAVSANPDLAAETSDAWDLGAEWRSTDGRGNLSATWFKQDTKNLITFAFATGGYQNIARAESKGIELDASYQLTEWLGIDASYAWIDAEDRDAGTRLVLIPKHSGNVTLRLQPSPAWSAQLTLRHNGKERDPNGIVDSWTRVDLAGRVAIRNNLDVFARVENLFDEEYQQILGYGTPGISASAGVRLRF